MLILCVAATHQGIGYIDGKHKDGIDRIDQTQKEIMQMKVREVKSQMLLRSIERNVDNMAGTMKIMDQRIWELYRNSKRSRISEDDEESEYSSSNNETGGSHGT